MESVSTHTGGRFHLAKAPVHTDVLLKHTAFTHCSVSRTRTRTHTHARTHTLAFSPVRIVGFFFFQVWSLTPRHTQCLRGPRFESRPHSPSVSPTPFLSHHY